MAGTMSLPSSFPEKEVRDLKPNDVLLGRGPQLSQFEGNLRFRMLVDEHKHLYTGTTNRKEKKRIAQGIRDIIKARGGRFLKQKDAGGYEDEDVWVLVEDEDVIAEKCKQALREKHTYAYSSSRDTDGVNGSFESMIQADFQPSYSSQAKPSRVGSSDSIPASTESSHLLQPPFHTDTLPLSLQGASGREEGCLVQDQKNEMPCIFPMAGCSATVPAALLSFDAATPLFHPLNAPTLSAPVQPSCTLPSFLDPRLLLFRHISVAFNQQLQSALLKQVLETQVQSNIQNGIGSSSQRMTAVDQRKQRVLQDLLYSANLSSMTSILQNSLVLDTNTVAAPLHNTSQDGQDCCKPQDLCMDDSSWGDKMMDDESASGSDDSCTEMKKQDPSAEEDLAAFLLASLAVADRQVITNEQEAQEREGLTDDEKAAALADTFGKLCEPDVPQRKRARRDLDPSSVAFLVRQMRCELERIPVDRKRALVEAQSKCSASEFNNSRLEKFLRCEGMNAKLAAQRFVNYWESRCQVFGEEKYLMKMTLSGAVRDDLTALSAGVFCLLPKLDASGRQIMYMEARRHTMNEYDSDSLLRAIWYTVEVTAQENTDINSGIVQVVFLKGATIWDYDKIYDKVAEFYSNCFPIKILASHKCCPPKIITRVIIPIIHTFMNKEFRTRSLTHDVPEGDLLENLSKYGIEKEMLPVEMGGTIELNQSEWIANRWAAELEEI